MVNGFDRSKKRIQVTMNEDAGTFRHDPLPVANHDVSTTPAVFELDAWIQFKLRGVRKD